MIHFSQIDIIVTFVSLYWYTQNLWKLSELNGRHNALQAFVQTPTPRFQKCSTLPTELQAHSFLFVRLVRFEPTTPTLCDKKESNLRLCGFNAVLNSLSYYHIFGWKTRFELAKIFQSPGSQPGPLPLRNYNHHICELEGTRTLIHLADHRLKVYCITNSATNSIF